jgi:two-component system, cell cycle sensor histidine kinase and response regulator CckA
MLFVSRLILAAWLCLCVVYLPNAIAQKLPFRHYGVEDGLSESTVEFMIQDQLGYLWISTWGGLNRFDGHEFTVYRMEDGLPDNRISDLYEDTDHNLWIGTRGNGISRFDGESFQNYSLHEKMQSGEVHAILPGQQDTLWFGTHADGISIYHDGRFEPWPINEALPTDTVDALLEDRQGQIWLGTKQGLCRYDGRELTVYTTVHGLRDNWVKTLFEDTEGNIWAGTAGGGISRFDNGTFETYTTEDGLVDNRVLHIAQDFEGALWISTMQGASKYSKGVFQSITVQQGLLSNSVNFIFEDRERNIWFCTRRGLSRLITQAFTHYEMQNDSRDIDVLSIHSGPSGKMYVGTRGDGVFQIMSGGLQAVPQESSAGNQAVFEDSREQLWIGSRYNGLQKYYHGVWTKFYAEQGMTADRVWDILEDRQGTIWFASLHNGLYKYNPASESFTQYTIADGLPSNRIFTIYEDTQGDLWFGTDDGACQMRDGRFIIHRIDTPRVVNNIQAIEEDTAGNFWFGMREGLWKYDGSNFTNVSAVVGVSPLYYQSLRMMRGRLYAATAAGLLSIDPVSYDVRQYNKYDGLFSSEMNHDAMFVDADSTLWIGTRKGLIHYQPDREFFNFAPLPIYIAGIRIGNRDTVTISKLDLQYDQDDIAINYHSISLASPDEVQYRYRLEGYEDKWVRTENEMVHYTNLDPGAYRFFVESRSGDGVWSEMPATVSIIIASPWWATWWFRLMALLGILSSIVAVHRYRTISLTRQNVSLQKEIDERKIAEAALRDAQLLLESSIESPKDMIILSIDREYRYLFFNQTHKKVMKQVYGTDAEIGKNILDCIPVDTDRIKIKRYYDRAMNGESVTVIDEYGGVDPIYIETLFNPICNHANEIIGITAFALDITQQRVAEQQRQQLEDQLRQAQKMESIGRLAGGIAHDFNNILTGILGYSELLKLQFPDASTPEGEAASMIIKGGKRAAGLTQQLLGFARGGKYQPEPLDMHVVLLDAVKVSEKIFEKNIHIHYKLYTETAVVEADKNQLHQVFTNLIINARDAMPQGGNLTFETNKATLDTNDVYQYPGLTPGCYIQIDVTDTGVGMPENIREHIFEPFFTTKGKGEGTGLGLAMVYGIVKHHKGGVYCASESGQGTCFTVFLPATDKQIVKTTSTESIVTGSATILLVDDEEVLRNAVKALLQNLGYMVITAFDGQDAVEKYREQRETIDLVLLDMIMPRMAGRETFFALKEMNPEVRVLLISGFSQDHRTAEIMQAGALEFIQKPVTLASLSKAVSAAL